MFYLLLPSLDARTRLIAHLERARDPRRLPLPAAAPLRDGPPLGGREGHCPVTEDVTDRLLRLPFYTGLDRGRAGEVIEAVL